MHSILVGAAIVLACAMALSLYRILRGPSAYDRLTGLGLIGTKTVALLAVAGTLAGRVELFVDITLTYALLGFIGTLILAKYFEHKEADRL